MFHRISSTYIKLNRLLYECNLSFISNTVYFKKSLQNEIKNYDRKNYMLECDYSKEHGVFHNCSVKMYKQS
jgi:hypothetical protein